MFFSCSVQNYKSLLWKRKINTHLITRFFELSYTPSGTAHNTQSSISSFLVSLHRNGNQSCAINTLSLLVLLFLSAVQKIWEPTRGTKEEQEPGTDFWRLGWESRKMFTHKSNVGFSKPSKWKCVLVVRIIWLYTWFSFHMSANVFTMPAAFS